MTGSWVIIILILNVFACDRAISFWGGIDAHNGDVIDRNHPLANQCTNGGILAIPSGRGSCTGSAVILELLLRKCAPAGLIFGHTEQILTLGVLVARAMFDTSIPVVVLGPLEFAKLQGQRHAAIKSGTVLVGDSLSEIPEAKLLSNPKNAEIELTPLDKSILAGEHGKASKLALEVILSFATLQGANKLLNVTKAHIDACIYTGPAGLKFAETMLTMGGRFVIPTTLNSISIDQRRWKEIGMDQETSQLADRLANTYVAMGAQPSFTCAPYALETIPEAGEDVAWAESNAVTFLNSVLGARTQKYPDFLDVCIALTGRAPLAGPHLPEGRLPSMRIDVAPITRTDDATFSMLGYVVGKLSQHEIPLVCGMELLSPHMADLKNFSAAFGTTSSAPMFHIRGITPEAGNYSKLEAQLRGVELDQESLLECWHILNSAQDPSLGLVSLGNPHFLFEEFATLSKLCQNRRRHPQVEFIITTNRFIEEKARKSGYIKILEDFGASIVTDTCWCMLGEPVVPRNAVNVVTNSAKYAHYGPSLVRKGFHFGSLAQCVDAAYVGEFAGEYGNSA